MDKAIQEWLLEDKNQEIKLRVLKEALGYKDNDPEVITTKENLMNSKVYKSALTKLHYQTKHDFINASKLYLFGGQKILRGYGHA